MLLPTLECRFQSLPLNQGRRNSGLCSLLPGPLALICCNRASTLNTKHIDVLENPGGSLPFLVRRAWHAGRGRRRCLARTRSGASSRSQLIICQELCPPRGQGWVEGQRGHRSRLRARESVWTGPCAHSSGLWTNDKEGRKRGREREGGKEGGRQAECHPAIVLAWASSLPGQCHLASSQGGTRVRGSWTEL